MKKLLNVSALFFAIYNISAQDIPSFQSPEPPKVFEFTKYDQMPAGEYTGIPNISVPLYDINVDDVKIPISLQYHAGGIRVSEEASQVGLGWNLNFGQLTQTVNGRNDFDNNPKLLLKYDSSDFVSEWPGNMTFGNNYQCTEFNGYNPSQPLPKSSMFIATNDQYPIQNQSYCFPTYNFGYYDMEPDIFRINFFGTNLKFIKSFTTGAFEVLNNKGYKIEYNNNEWKIINPNGEQFFFGLEKRSYSQSLSFNTSIEKGAMPTSEGNAGGGTSTTVIWQLVKIVTNKNKTITFEYNDFGQSTTKSYSQAYVYSERIFQSALSTIIPMYWKGYMGQFWNDFITRHYIKSTTYASGSPEVQISKIKTPEQQIVFNYSERIDKIGKKLDDITQMNLYNRVIKKYNLTYDYFVSTPTGNEINMYKTSGGEPVITTGALNTKRLKLSSVKADGEQPYIFLYNPVNLPVKNSTAVDYWGFYNGQFNNTSIAPNPVKFGMTAYGDNGNNNTSYSIYTKACHLEKINFPTGGYVQYDYELNEYDNNLYDTNMANTENVISGHIKGAGLRISMISFYDNIKLLKKTSYFYENGKYITPTRYFNNYYINLGDVSINQYTTRKVSEFYGQNYYSPSTLGSIQGVGYNYVVRQDITNQNTGKTITYFHNNIDKKPSNLGIDYYNEDLSYGEMALPSLVDINTVENGKPIKEEVLDANNNLKQLKEYFYLNKKSNIHYGNKISFFRKIISTCMGQFCPENFYAYNQNLVGYYAIFDKQSLLSSQKVTEFFPSASKYNSTTYSYDANNLMTYIETISQSGNTVGRESTSYYSTPALMAKNQLNLPQRKVFLKNGQTNYLTYSYQTTGLNLLEKLEQEPGGSTLQGYIKKVFYDRYDDLGNLLEFHTENGTSTCVIWGYDSTLPIAKIENATYPQISTYATGLQNLSNTGTEDNLIIALDNLRTALPNAMVTAYTHIPGIGVSSITDSKGATAYYKYDTSGRLESIKDEEKKLLLEYEYHFRPQN